MNTTEPLAGCNQVTLHQFSGRKGCQNILVLSNVMVGNRLGRESSPHEDDSAIRRAQRGQVLDGSKLLSHNIGGDFAEDGFRGRGIETPQTKHLNGSRSCLTLSVLIALASISIHCLLLFLLLLLIFLFLLFFLFFLFLFFLFFFLVFLLSLLLTRTALLVSPTRCQLLLFLAIPTLRLPMNLVATSLLLLLLLCPQAKNLLLQVAGLLRNVVMSARARSP
mmetsp:Transcript_1741/g.3282  ORF Transcript_1741/g.3282 Transcript_1741/m.3282 type:complete len:221 (-) Transcript_1741:466-1128(-)